MRERAQAQDAERKERKKKCGNGQVAPPCIFKPEAHACAHASERQQAGGNGHGDESGAEGQECQCTKDMIQEAKPQQSPLDLDPATEARKDASKLLREPSASKIRIRRRRHGWGLFGGLGGLPTRSRMLVACIHGMDG